MATIPKLLSIPLEIRRQIYFYLLPNRLNINIVRDDMDGPLRISLIRVCRAIYLEATDYYYSTNKFLLDLSDPSYAPNRFVNGTNNLLLKYIRRVKTLQLVIGDWTSPIEHPRTLSQYAQEQCDWFLKTLQDAKEDHEGLWLRDLVVLDLCVTLISGNEIAPQSVERGARRRETLVQLFGPFKNRIRDVRIESRVLSQPRRYDPIHDIIIAPVWDTVIGVSYVDPSKSLPSNKPLGASRTTS